MSHFFSMLMIVPLTLSYKGCGLCPKMSEGVHVI